MRSSQPLEPASPEGPCSVVLVDDNERFLTRLEALLLRDDRLRVVGKAMSGAEGVAVVAARQPDLLLLDLDLPDGSGLDFITAFWEARQHLPIIILTFHDEPGYAEAAMAAGCQALVTKSTLGRRLMPEIRRVLEQL